MDGAGLEGTGEVWTALLTKTQMADSLPSMGKGMETHQQASTGRAGTAPGPMDLLGLHVSFQGLLVDTHIAMSLVDSAIP